MRCPRDYCGGVLEVHNQDFHSDYYCLDGCGYEERVRWETKAESPKNKERQEPAPARKKINKGRDRQR